MSQRDLSLSSLAWVWEIPGSWAWVKMTDIADVVGGGTPPTSDPANFDDGGIPWITPADLSGYREKHISRGARNITERGLKHSGARLMPAGTVLFSSRAPVGYVAIAATPVTTNQGFKSFVLASGVDPSYVYFYLKKAKGSIETLAGGTTFKEISGARATQIPLPLAPAPEQHRIVAEIEKHFARLAAAVASLKRVRANLKRYRSSVLRAACEGRLVPTEAELARREDRDYEPASVLLERILRERRAQWEGYEKRGGNFRESRPPDTSSLPPLPESWMWASIGQCFKVHVGATPSRARSEYWGGNIPWVSSGEVAFTRIRQTRETITEDGFKKTHLDLHPPGTILLGMIGEGKTRGQVAILDIGACNNQNSAAIRISETDAIPEYLYYFLWSEYEHVRKRGSGGNQPALNRSRVEEIAFPLPPLAEQRRIVAEVERHMSVIQAAENMVGANMKRAERLHQAILRRAFEGKLVPQDPTDESTSVLLERIRTGREQSRRNTVEARRKTGRRRKIQEVPA